MVKYIPKISPLATCRWRKRSPVRTPLSGHGDVSRGERERSLNTGEPGNNRANSNFLAVLKNAEGVKNLGTEQFSGTSLIGTPNNLGAVPTTPPLLIFFSTITPNLEPFSMPPKRSKLCVKEKTGGGKQRVLKRYDSLLSSSIMACIQARPIVNSGSIFDGPLRNLQRRYHDSHSFLFAAPVDTI